MPRWIANSPENEGGTGLQAALSFSNFAARSPGPMNLPSSDPNNQVPEVSPNDAWDDAEKSIPEPSSKTNILPPRRSAADRSTEASISSTEGGSAGLRIDSNVQRLEHSQSPQRIQVQEIKATVVRLDQMAPSPPKVARQVAFHQRPIHEKDQSSSSGESSTWGAASKLSKRWIFGSGAAVVVIVILSMILLPVLNSRNAQKASSRTIVVKPFNDEKIDRFDTLDPMLDRQPEAIRIFQTYLAATQVDQVIPLIRDGKALEETLRGHWHPTAIPKRWTIGPDCAWSLKKIADHPYGILSGTLPDHSSFTAYFTKDGDRLRLDWKATSGFGTATFAELEKNMGNPAEVRGEISLAQFYTSTWPEADYQSFRLTSPDGQDILWCYSRRGQQVHDALGPFFRKDQLIVQTKNSWRITLRLAQGPAGALPNQWLIGEMLHIDWVTP